MKQFLKDFTSFSRLERMGFSALAGIVALLFIAWQTIPYLYSAPTTNDAENRKMALAWKEYKAAHLSADELESGGNLPVANIPIQLVAFDPNTLDSIGFLKLGLSPRVVKGLMNWRRHGKVFYKKEDLKPLYNLTPEDYARLEPYVTISATNTHAAGYPKSYTSGYTKLPPLPATLDLNTTDSATLVRLNGIGPTLAHKIIARRTALGGFLKIEQITEVYKFSDSTLTMLKEKLIMRPEAIKRISINSATIEILQSHPYIGEKYANNIIRYRNALKRFDNIAQLRQVPLMNEEIYRKIAPYLVID